MLKPYQKYKDSGVEWIGQIPEKWDVKKLKHISNIQTGGTPPKNDADNYADDGLIWVKPDDLSEFVPITDTKERVSPFAFDKISIIPERSPLVCCIGTVGKFGYSEQKCCTNQQINALIFSNKINDRYGLYVVSSLEQEHRRVQNKNVVAIVNATSQGEISIPFPEIDNQINIAAFLDRKIMQVDDLIAKKERMIELLKEQRAAVINEAVTKGLDRSVKMKDSGVEWIGEVPEHWEVKRLKFICDLINQSAIPNNESVKVDLENIESWTGKINLNVENNEGEDKEIKSYKKGDVLFNKLRPYLAKVYLAQEDGFCGGELLVLRPNEFISSKFLFYRVISEAFINIVNGSTYGSKMPRASWDFIGNLKTFFPDLNAQVTIINYLEKQIMQIESLIIKEEKSIEYLKVFSVALISEVVTGKIEITQSSKLIEEGK